MEEQAISCIDFPSFDSESFKLGTVLTVGKFGTCQKVFVKNYGVCVMKTVNNVNQSELKELVRSQMLNHHPCFVAIFGIVEFKENPNSAGLLVEYMTGGTLNGIFGQNYNIGVKLKILWCYEIAMGLAYLHENKILHRDLRPEKIFLSADVSKLPKNLCASDLGIDIHVKLAHVGISRVIDSDSMCKRGGSIWYMAPEVIESEGNVYDFPADVFSYALTVNSIFTERRPFCDEPERWTESDHISRMLGMKPSLSTRPPIPPGIGQLEGIIKNCWLNIPERRMKMEEVCELLQKAYNLGMNSEDSYK